MSMATQERSGLSAAQFRRLSGWALMAALPLPALDDPGLVKALQMFVARVGAGEQLRVDLRLPTTPPPLSAAAEVAIYRIVQDAVANVIRHAAARSCTVTLQAEGGAVLVQVQDDDCGIAPRRHRGRRPAFDAGAR